MSLRQLFFALYNRLPRKLPKHRLTYLFCAGLCVSPLHYTK